MVTTRSMSGTTKNIDTKIDVNDKQKAAKRANNKAKSGTTKINDTEEYVVGWPLIMDAYPLFMVEFKEKYYNDHPQCPKRGAISIELRDAIRKQWSNMSDTDKAPYFENAKEMRAAKKKEMRAAKKMRAEGHTEF